MYGFQVSAADSAAGNAVGVDIVQGNDLTVTGVPAGPVPANTPVTLHVTYANAVTSAGPVQGRAAARPGRGSDSSDGADHDQRGSVSARRSTERRGPPNGAALARSGVSFGL